MDAVFEFLTQISDGNSTLVVSASVSRQAFSSATYGAPVPAAPAPANSTSKVSSTFAVPSSCSLAPR